MPIACPGAPSKTVDISAPLRLRRLQILTSLRFLTVGADRTTADSPRNPGLRGPRGRVGQGTRAAAKVPSDGYLGSKSPYPSDLDKSCIQGLKGLLQLYSHHSEAHSLDTARVPARFDEQAPIP